MDVYCGIADSLDLNNDGSFNAYPISYMLFVIKYKLEWLYVINVAEQTQQTRQGASLMD